LDLIEIFPVNISITRVSLAYALKVSGGRKDRQRIRRDANLALYDSFAVITPAPLKAAQEVTMSTPTRTFDYIVVGAGSAGAIVAARLTADPVVNVLLLEADSEDDSYWSKIPPAPPESCLTRAIGGATLPSRKRS
jgi:hypothetical protein